MAQVAASVRRVLDNVQAVCLWLAFLFAGFAVGWLYLQPAWFYSGVVVGSVTAFALVNVKARRSRR